MIKITNDEFKLLSTYIKECSGINLKAEKKALLMGRLISLVTELKMDSFMEFYEYLKNDREGLILSKVIDRITTNHTYFMRETDHFSYLQSDVLPFMKSTIKDKDLRVWCAASSTGEEPYTLAMILEDYFSKEIVKWDKKLLATDISLDVLDTAKKGIYLKEKVESIPRMWVLNYFKKMDGVNFQIKDDMKSQVIYRRFNLLEPVFPFKKKFHVIFCRNVMIYFDNKTKEELINKFYNALEYGGYLFIGHSESIDRNKTQFKYVKPAVYRKL